MDTRLAVVVAATAFTLLGTLAFSFAIGRRHSKADDWQTGGRSLPLYVIAGTQLATLMGGGVLVGHVGIGYQNGWSTVTYGLLTAVGMVPLVIMARWLRRGGLSSLPDVLGKLYGRNRVMDVITIVMSIVIPFGWLCTNLVAFGNLFSLITGVSSNLLIPVFGVLCLGFVLPAGLTSVAWTDFFFGVGMVVLAGATTVFTLSDAGGWSQIRTNLPSDITDFPAGMGSVGTLAIVFWVLAVMPGNLTNQQVYQRVFAAGDTRGARVGIIIAAVLYAGALVWAGAMGMAIRSMNPKLDNPEMAMGWLLTRIPTPLLALFAAFIVATIMSTASSAVQSAVVNLTKDIYKDYVDPDVPADKLLRMSRLASVGIVALGVALAVFYSEALQWLVMTFAYSVSALLMPILVGFALRRTGLLNSAGAVGGMICGLLGAAVAHAVGTEWPYVAFGMLSSFVGLFVFSLAFRGRSGRPDLPGDATPRTVEQTTA